MALQQERLSQADFKIGVKVMIGAIWPSFYTMKNTFSTSLPMQTSDFIAWFIFTFFCFVAVLVRPEVFHWPAVVTSCSMFIFSLTMMAWLVNKAGGPGPLFQSSAALTGIEPATGSQLAWMAVRTYSTVISSVATGLIGYADWGRYAKTTNAHRFPQAIGVTLGNIYVVRKFWSSSMFEADESSRLLSESSAHLVAPLSIQKLASFGIPLFCSCKSNSTGLLQHGRQSSLPRSLWWHLRS